MKNKLFTIAALSMSIWACAQVGINTSDPQATLDVVGFPSVTTKLDGVIAPRLSGYQLRQKTYTGSQTGALVYVTSADGNPDGQTASVLSAGYYYFDGSKWSQLGADWHTMGNIGTSATTSALGTDITSGNYLGTADDQKLILATKKNVKGILDSNGNFQGGNMNASGPYASFTWGSNNTLGNTASSNIALGRENTVYAQGANFPGITIGMKNKAGSGAKLIGNNNYGIGANTLVFGNGNGSDTFDVAGITVGNGNTNDGGIIVGSGNTAGTNTMAFGANASASGSYALAFGFSAQASASQSVYGNTAHVFSGQGAAGTAITDVGVNMVPNENNFADLEVSKAILIKASTRPACNASNAGTIIYELSGNTGSFVGCKQTGANTFAWQTL
ncbi:MULTISPECIES: hypothetical protein [Chryseobacterium]|uniref:Trimeric autotransporter adhesin YadA-like head domain-containing protein n=1 Tax=Chryseobacterium camelliae TaxID=1265445 RepID=A0ABU0TKX0_9FLAO|nr:MULTISPECIES: hypothetical protein [Chryseobacterium]MDT3408452.1 hypothetical protein [Pseudacidovorax intermedius]MDQ1097691.1 hypothetical protein [Chryseobacterium camelliae]MDQ1101622.1 hypothetical protein [Chryseobacterium sp. SORGH_AS_1048]MDR6085064.1 hypothetical protein [Chryseobacterium sp. SORGH_AS_0909]MDR6129419.1 hypothetical protein [Chryseobacterium sp. SORGH_AS_1175]